MAATAFRLRERHYHPRRRGGRWDVYLASISISLATAIRLLIDTTDSNSELRKNLVEEYSNEERPSDGEIYRKVRQYEREGNVCFKKRRKARLSAHGRRGLQQLFGHGDRELAAAFDCLLDIPGFWNGMRISMLYKMISMNVTRWAFRLISPSPAHDISQEILHYPDHVKTVWHQLLHGDKPALAKVDQVTVRAVELRAPRYSKQDALLLQGQLLSGQIFGAFSREEPEAIWQDLRSVDGLIPPLFTFFEDLKYLGACADCLKQLVKLSRGDTVSIALQRKFPHHDYANDQVAIRAAESSFVLRSGAVTDRFDLAYRQLWLSAMRHYREMPTEVKKKKKDLLTKAGAGKADEETLFDFAALADRLGFESNNISALKQRSPDREIAHNALLKARKPDRFQYDEVVLESHISQIVNLFTAAVPLSSETSSPSFISDNPDAPGKRSGFPDEDAPQHNIRLLFLPHLHKEVEEMGDNVTSFFVRRSVYWAFFGKTVNLGTEQGSRTPSQIIASTDIRERYSVYSGSEIALQGRRHQERLEQERLEQERLEQARQIQTRLEQARLEQEQEQARLEQERLEQEHLEQERLEQERLEQERLKQEQGRLESTVRITYFIWERGDWRISHTLDVDLADTVRS